MDIGANGGVVYDDVRVIAKYSDRTEDAQGLGNHEIVSIPLAN